jgi:hypothetical protein
MNKSFVQRIGLALVVTTSALLSGCATVTKGSSQTVTIDTRPPGATCTLTRGGKKLAIVNPTPGSISVEKASEAISVSCIREGYQESAGTLESSFQTMTFGNILLGGLIGVAVDAASGALHEYQPMVTITLIPVEFASAADRDAFFANMKAEFLTEFKEVTTRIEGICDTPYNCDRQLKAAEVAKEARLSDIEKKRLLAKVRQ